ncbi:VPA1269 family protein [Cupriavidus necator]|uniref:gamma-mobile-trio integrase GmtZ n=1 Tax=Cupriavidus necator TaxID=106590 RepID=UPI00339D5802
MKLSSTPKIDGIPAPASPTRRYGVTKDNDTTLGWVAREYPQLEAWRLLAVEWLRGETRGVDVRLWSLVIFLKRYIVGQGLPLNPALFLACDTVLPDFYTTACPDSRPGVTYNNYIHAFLTFVLQHKFSELDDQGNVRILPTFHNPVAKRSTSKFVRLDESVHSPLPYGYVDELRQILAQGPHFRDWTWAQSALGVEVGQGGYAAPDWFSVSEDQVDRSDPDCVWRVRQRTKRGGGPVMEIWSPVRWVALLVKLILPLRTYQVRMLDSGEADTWRYDSANAGPSGAWQLNTHPRSRHLVQGSERKPLQQGVFRRNRQPGDTGSVATVLYVNTNKTADMTRSGSEKGYLLPWPAGGPLHQDVFYWLEKLRNWQRKYNPIQRRTPWSELDRRHIAAKSDVQLAGCPDACFLFRTPEERDGNTHLPIAAGAVERVWFALLEGLECRLAARNETHANGAPIKLLPPSTGQNSGMTTLFPLHSLRVSLVTALALEGQVPFPVLQKLVGHSRLLMTLYYIKPGASHVRDVLNDAARRLEARKEASIQTFLLDAEYEHLLETAVCNSPSSLAVVIPPHPASRNAAGWMPMHHGLCLVGGNTSEVEGNGAVGGCYNGGPLIGPPSQKKFSAVPGGSRNCVRCRWFVTEPHHLPALAAHFNNVAYHFDEARNACLRHESARHELRRQKAATEAVGRPFTEQAALRQAERVWEADMKRFSDLAEDLVACWRLIERCKNLLDVPQGGGAQLVPVGTVVDVQVAFEETESELLQLAGVCQDTELYPDLNPGKAVIRRSQLLDTVLCRDGLPPLFMHLAEKEQLRVGNAFMRRLARQMGPDNPALGMRQVVELMDAGQRLSDYLGIDLDGLLPAQAQSPRPLNIARLGGLP